MDILDRRNPPDAIFTKIVTILSAYCIFPEKYLCVFEPPVELVEKMVAEDENDDWFKPAGDL